MSTIAKLSGEDFDRMVSRGAFIDLEPMKVELLSGELRFMNPSGPVHEGEIASLLEWSFANSDRQQISIRVQSAIACGEHRPEPDLVWVRKLPSRRIRPTHEDVQLLIEVADSSLVSDLDEKAKLYAQHAIPEFWVVDIKSESVHVHRSPRNGQYDSVDVLRPPSQLSPLCQPMAALGLSELFDLDS